MGVPCQSGRVWLARSSDDRSNPAQTFHHLNGNGVRLQACCSTANNQKSQPTVNRER
ncbi:hypothetical protein IQ235_18445 [Oscillatoriales cyanobacterium LEGE 11467]|uniref:Uncharacterized protein n=1 Tax=Zarconia navalis LEGE 11467 TaxID=1828826 RepID=A0A928ZAJ3_9CYAN|nr:hypothetical protein [Zarconia navalis]MBE9042743.1 hypothetical protein [Zarconia navalis LEGE 11467]